MAKHKISKFQPAGTCISRDETEYETTAKALDAMMRFITSALRNGYTATYNPTFDEFKLTNDHWNAPTIYTSVRGVD